MFYRKIIFGYFQSIGISTIAWENINGTEMFVHFWFNLNLLIVLIIIGFTYYYEKIIFYQKDTVGKFTDVIQVAGTIFTHLVILVENIITRKHQLNIWRKLREVDAYFTSLNTLIDERRMYRNYFIKLLVITLITTMSELTIMSGIRHNRQWSLHWYSAIISYFVCRSGILYFILFVDLLHDRLRYLVDELNKLSRDITNKHETIICQIQRDRKCYQTLLILKRILNSLWEISISLNESFGWGHLLNISNYFILLTSDVYWVYFKFYFGREKDTQFGEKFMLQILMEPSLNIVSSYLPRICLVRVPSFSDFVNYILLMRASTQFGKAKYILC